MKSLRLIVLLALANGLLAACAAGPEIKYAMEAERVKTQAIEPVTLSPEKLEDQLRGKYSSSLSNITAEQLIDIIRKEVATTKRFTKVMVGPSAGNIFEIRPKIDRIDFFEAPISYDPNRKKVYVKTKVSADILLRDRTETPSLEKTFEDERKIEKTVPVDEVMNSDKKQELFRRAIETGFRALADQIGNEFNPSYEMGTVSKVDGRRAYVQINTSFFKAMRKKQVDVIDDDNNVLAIIDEMSISDGALSGKYSATSGESVKPGMKVRARIKTFD
jgi:hypothetical protein